MSEEYGNDFITLVNEDGEEVEFECIDIAEYNDERYAALVPVYSSPEQAVEADGELVILRMELDDATGEEVLVTIDDEDEYDDVCDFFMDRLEDFYEIEN